METIIDNMDDEDFKGKTLFTYTFAFKDMNKEQKDFVIAQFDDWSWGMGLNIAELKVSLDGEQTKFIFKSPKPFEDKDDEDWDENDIENNILTKLIGKEQFVPNFEFSECGVDELEISFFDDKGEEYEVEVDKYSSIINKNEL